MIFGSIKKLITPSFCSKIDKWVYRHKCDNRSFHKNIIFCFYIDTEFIKIAAHSKSNNINIYGSTGGVREIFTCQVNSIEEGLNQITLEASKAKKKYANLDFFRQFDLLENDSRVYVKKKNSLPASQKIDMIFDGSTEKTKTVSIFEEYSAGTWLISDFYPWEKNDVDEFGDRYDGEPY